MMGRCICCFRRIGGRRGRFLHEEGWEGRADSDWDRAEILKHLEEGRHVLLDRYILSGIAFSVAKGLDFDWCRAPDVGLPWPDVTIVLELDAEEQEKRGGYGGERYEVPKLQAEVKRVFGQLGGTKVDAKGSVDEVERRIWAVVEEALKNRQEEVGVFH